MGDLLDDVLDLKGLGEARSLNAMAQVLRETALQEIERQRGLRN